DAPCGQFVHDLVVDAIPPGGGAHAHVAEDHLRAALLGRLRPDGDGLFHHRVDLRAGKVAGVGREHTGVEGELATVGGDGQRVVLSRVYLLRADALVPFHQLVLEPVLLVGHRAGDDVWLAAFEPRPG